MGYAILGWLLQFCYILSLPLLSFYFSKRHPHYWAKIKTPIKQAVEIQFVITACKLALALLHHQRWGSKACERCKLSTHFYLPVKNKTAFQCRVNVSVKDNIKKQCAVRLPVENASDIIASHNIKAVMRRWGEGLCISYLTLERTGWTLKRGRRAVNKWRAISAYTPARLTKQMVAHKLAAPVVIYNPFHDLPQSTCFVLCYYTISALNGQQRLFICQFPYWMFHTSFSHIATNYLLL